MPKCAGCRSLSLNHRWPTLTESSKLEVLWDSPSRAQGGSQPVNHEHASSAYAKSPLSAGLVLELDVVANAELLDESTILFDITLLDVSQQTTTLTDEHQKTAAGVMVLLVDLQVLGQVLDADGEDCNLDLGRTRVLLVLAILLDDLFDLLLGDGAGFLRHVSHLSWGLRPSAAVASRMYRFALGREAMQVVRGIKAEGIRTRRADPPNRAMQTDYAIAPDACQSVQ